jgi:hypothetical protein
MRKGKERAALIKATSTVLFCHLSGLSEMTRIKKKNAKVQCGSFAISYKLTLEEKRIKAKNSFLHHQVALSIHSQTWCL